MGILVKNDRITKVGLTEHQRAQIHHHCTARHNQLIRVKVRLVVEREVMELETRLLVLRTWLQNNKRRFPRKEKES